MTPRLRPVEPDRLVEHVREGGLLPPGRSVLVLLSGGRDSTCLLDVALRLTGAGAVSALHVNYGLRAGADGDERHCRSACDAAGVELEVSSPRAPARAGNLQVWARDARYGAAARLALRRGARVATGHTATDQAETVLHRLAAAPGRRGLLGMAARDGLLVRPLLDFTREETADYCRARGLAWREDASNELSSEDHVYTRARVRGELMPALRAIHPAAEANVVRTAQLLRDEADVLDAVVDGVLEGRRRIELARLAALPPALRRLVARRLAGDVPAAATRVDELLALDPDGSAAVDLGDGLRAVVEYGVLRFTRGPAPAAPDPVHLRVPGEVAFGAWTVRCHGTSVGPRDGVLDAAALRGPLTVRAWRAGDRMAPLGLGGTRKLADLFADRHVPREARRVLPIVECGGEIAWVPGVATGARFAVSPDTEEAVLLTAAAAS
ncbi:MAG: tRNA(Ile)-lysidine synthase [Solirubrobacteraceae bacterium]|nr:tRNA(Ile)-lysidine synthase [Solirubrobacteraceae bacterium]